MVRRCCGARRSGPRAPVEPRARRCSTRCTAACRPRAASALRSEQLEAARRRSSRVPLAGRVGLAEAELAAGARARCDQRPCGGGRRQRSPRRSASPKRRRVPSGSGRRATPSASPRSARSRIATATRSSAPPRAAGSARGRRSRAHRALARARTAACGGTGTRLSQSVSACQWISAITCTGMQRIADEEASAAKRRRQLAAAPVQDGASADVRPPASSCTSIRTDSARRRAARARTSYVWSSPKNGETCRRFSVCS